ncbi:glucose PTS transporter subunit IIA [Rothia sp. (in: high G+C Gram-positive bacteria)]|uniref:glucose PTS transporter subunit IIA n=1 Tax=Rothia sp. (in: high G+C Gram-positive bacteria) TaxID=1885016 RepID=UPI0025E8D733|nr:glucose PTS transporter subunit IIA [Rothia sp. (in: high G+C Gram-positive bacteria)]
MNNRELGEKILDGLGGPENIAHITHCATRLRVTPVSNDAVQNKKIEALPGVLSVIEQSGQTQVVLGDRVEAVYNEINALPSMSGHAEGDTKVEAEGKKTNWINNVFDVLSDSFRPLLWALLGTSMILTLIVFLQQLGFFGQYTDLTGQSVNIDIINGARLADEKAATALNNQWMQQFAFWYILKAASLSVLNFMPIMLGATAAKRLGANMWVGAAIPAALMTGTFTALTDLADPATKILNVPFFGLDLPLYAFSYTGQVFPPLLAVALLAPLERFLKKVIPSMLQMVFVPMLSVMILVPLTAFLVGPIGIGVAMSISDFLKMVNDQAPALVGALIAGLYLFMVPLGLHWPLNAVMINNLQTMGTDFIQSPMGAYNFAVFGLVTGVAIKAKHDRELRQTAVGASMSGLLGGISEPSLYGVVLPRFNRVLPLILVPAVIGGATISFLGVKSHAFAFTSLLSIPAMQPSHLYVIGLAIAFFGAMTGVLIFGYESKADAAKHAAERKAEEAEAAPKAEAEAVAAKAAPAAAAAATTAAASESAAAGEVIELHAPIEGTAVALSDVPDPIFAAGKLGEGVAIEPTGTTVVAPAAGKVAATYPSGHAVGLKLENGIELLIHVGLDTVNLDGKGFSVKVAKGDVVAAGDALIEFDPEVIKEAGYPLITPVIVTNTRKFAEVKGLPGVAHQNLSTVLKVTTK